jgi:hypothetical protein
MDLFAKITGIKYTPFLCRELEAFSFKDFKKALTKKATFILKISPDNKIAISCWVSPKRTRSYPYARVYDSLGFTGKKVTIIPVMKDEGKRGDRDFLQWDTVSLMSLLGVYVIITHYKDAARSKRYRHKITNQRFDVDYLKKEIKRLLSYQSDALHWNIEQTGKVGKTARKALDAYTKISKKLKVEMHSRASAEKRIKQLLKGKEEFMSLSRGLAKKAQKREALTIQPKEQLSGTKAAITIKNYLGGYYYFTSDEVDIKKNNVYLIEGKHSRTNSLPSLEDIKDGLLKMMLFTNLKNVKIDSKSYKPIPVLKLTIEKGFRSDRLTKSQKRVLELLKKEARKNGFNATII